MVRICLAVFLAACLLAVPGHSSEPGAVIVPGFGPEERARALEITLDGPDIVNPVRGATFIIVGPDPIDIHNKEQSIAEQAPWLFNEDECLFVHAFLPGGEVKPLDIELNIVVSQGKAIFRPKILIQDQEGLDSGRWFIVLDWNYGQNQTVHHTFTVGQNPNPDPPDPPDPDPPDPDPPKPPLDDLSVILLEEADDRMKGLAGASLNQHIFQVQEYLETLPLKRLLTFDDDQPAAKPFNDFTIEQGVKTRPALVVRVDSKNMASVVSFGKNAEETIAKLKEEGVKQ